MSAYEIVLRQSAIVDMDGLRKHEATMIADAMERHLRHEPRKESKSAIRKLRGIADPGYRLRVGNYRVSYNVDDHTHRVDILRVMHKDDTRSYYEEVK